MQKKRAIKALLNNFEITEFYKALTFLVSFDLRLEALFL